MYFAKVESLKTNGRPLFHDRIEAWEYGPVKPAVYHAFKNNGRQVVTAPAVFEPSDPIDDTDEAIIDTVTSKYSHLGAFDLVRLSHREGGAWGNKQIHAWPRCRHNRRWHHRIRRLHCPARHGCYRICRVQERQGEMAEHSSIAGRCMMPQTTPLCFDGMKEDLAMDIVAMHDTSSPIADSARISKAYSTMSWLG